MLVTSRSLEEYRAFFALTDDDLAGRILDCGSGASGFTAQSGAEVTAVDPSYRSPTEVREAALTGRRQGDAIVDRHDGRFVWEWYGTPARRAAMRAAACDAFVADLAARPDRYVTGRLPALPFADAAFDLVLCSHLLFTWSDVLDEAWHEAALLELLRVGREVRVFPLVVQGVGTRVPFMPGLLERLRAGGVDAAIRPVPYRFQVDGDEMLVLRPPSR